ncbi:unnamed protein product [Effrenium voratum]|uniref:CobW/HypB/UreG nucleotide-binding domain-containing protein n=1 Tax=Effrenium voratum TaxID=2562239 RepID=A0AA36HZJ4_9DINO|nr:unnamed protein product [Effrenium voratum]
MLKPNGSPTARPAQRRKAKNELGGGLTAAQKREAEACVSLQEQRVPATILTGFLGAGKTTFLNFVLKSLGHGQKIAVVQNEFGAVPVDDQLMLLEQSAAETIVMPNGCLCCRVRGDLVEALRRLAEKGDESKRMDALLVECSGLSEERDMTCFLLRRARERMGGGEL